MGPRGTSAPEAREAAARVRVAGDRPPRRLPATADHGFAQLHGLADAAIRLTAARDVDEALRLTAEAAQELVGTHQAAASRLVHGWDRATTHVALSEKYARWREYSAVPVGRGLVNVALRERRPVRLTARELAAHPEFRGLRDAPDHPPLPDYLAVPLLGRDGEALGLVQLSDKGSGEPFTAEDEAVTVQLAQLASSVIEAIAAREEAERQGRRARALERVGRAIASRLDLQEVVQLATDAATELTGARFGAFFYNVLDDAGESYTLYTLSGAPRSAFERFGMPRNTAVFGPTFAGEGVVRLDDVTADARYGRNPPHQGMPKGHLPVRSYLAVPVVTEAGEVAGGLFFGHPEVGVFDGDAEEAVVSIAAQAAVALTNAKLFDAAQREIAARRAAFEDRDRVASVLQSSLLPPTLPDIPGADTAARYRSGVETVGGDFYDLFPVSAERWGLALGDVCGRGPAAAARTAAVRHAIRTAAILQPSPADVLATANRAVLRDPSDERFTSAVFAHVIPGDGGLQVCFASAGHPPAVVRRRDGRVETLPPGGALLGVLEELRGPVHDLALAPGDALVLYTDGLVETRCERESFGEDRLCEAVAGGPPDETADALADRLLAATDAFADGRHGDDVALVVLRATG